MPCPAGAEAIACRIACSSSGDFMDRHLTDYSVLTFDCYGTLIDWESGIWDALQPLLMASGCEDVTRELALEAFAEVESDQQARTPDMLYSKLLTIVHSRLADRFGFKQDEKLDRAFGASVPYWPAFPDSADALRILGRHFKLVVLSNVDRAGFAASNLKLGISFDAVYTAEDVGSYKPNPRNFEYMVERLEKEHGISKDSILHTAQSLFHDHVEASRSGLGCAWVDRQGLSGGGGWGATAKIDQRPSVDFVFPTLAAMAEDVSAAFE